MADKETNFGANWLDMVQLLDESEVKSEMGEAFASFMLNPTVTWAKFILTDDRTNGNGERVPKEEFANLIRSGIHMPVKMVLGEIQGHPESKPLGTITHLKQVQKEDGSSAIVALAALWGKERPADVEFIKARFAEKKPVDVSWEILYETETINDETHSTDLHGTVLKAATIVGNPAYEGRTPFLSIASKKISDAAVEEITDDTNTEDNSMELKDLEARIAEIEPQLTEAQTQIAAKDTLIAEKDAEIARLTGELTAKEEELVPLRDFKTSADAEVAKQEKLEALKAKFVEAGLNKDDQYFTDNGDKLLEFDDNSLEFFIQEMSANLSTVDGKASQASSKTKIPALTGGDQSEDLSPKALAQYLRERGKK